MTSQPFFEPSCPSGGDWYACGNGTNFAGCCGKNPCTGSGCPDGLLYPASFNPNFYGNFTDSKCSNGAFYSCTGTIPPFLGCCDTNACSVTAGCPSSSLESMYLSKNPADAAQWDPQPPLAASASTSASASSSMPASTASADAIDESNGSPPLGAIVGGAVGGFALLCAVIFLVWRVRFSSRRSRKEHDIGGKHQHLMAGGYQADPKSGHGLIGSGYTQYTDSPPIAPPYSRHTSPVLSYPPATQTLNGPSWVVEVDGRSAHKSYSPQHQSALLSPSNYSPSHGLSPSLSGHEFGLATQWNMRQSARMSPVPPQELSGEPEPIGLGVHHVKEQMPRAELDGVANVVESQNEPRKN